MYTHVYMYIYKAIKMFFMLRGELTLHVGNWNKPNTKGQILQDLA